VTRPAIRVSFASPASPVFTLSGEPIGERAGVAALQEQLGLAARELAALCRVSERTVEGWRQGRPVGVQSMMAMGLLLTGALRPHRKRAKK